MIFFAVVVCLSYTEENETDNEESTDSCDEIEENDLFADIHEQYPYVTDYLKKYSISHIKECKNTIYFEMSKDKNGLYCPFTKRNHKFCFD